MSAVFRTIVLVRSLDNRLRDGVMYTHEDIGIRIIEARDLEAMRVLRNDSSTWIYLTDPHLITEESQKQWFSMLASRPDRMYFILFVAEHPFAGIVRMDEIDRQNRSIRVGVDIVPELRGRGLGKRALCLVQRYCFDILNMHRVWLAVLVTNARARDLYTKVGFVEEGRHREAVFRDGRYVDYIIMSILEHEYRA